MIKTHKPRGHLWTCPSVFQQSQEIRNIRFEDCVPPPAKVLCSDKDDRLSSAERAAKRRRIEKLADDFLNGQPLVIKSVRPHPSTLKAAIEGGERSRTNAKYNLPEVEISDDEDELWADEESSGELLARLREERLTKAGRKGGSKLSSRAPNLEGAVTVTEETAVSACKPVTRRVKAVKVSLDPSTDAIKQAAALRERRLKRAATEIPQPALATSADTINDSDGPELHSEPSSLARPRYFRTRKPEGTEWLLRRNTKLCELSTNESFDELLRASTPTKCTQTAAPMPEPSSPLPGGNRAPVPASAPLSSADPLSASFEGPKRTSIGHYEEDWSCYSNNNASTAPTKTSPADVDTTTSAAQGSYHTAPEETVLEAGGVSVPDQSDSQADSQTRLLRQHGVRSAPRRSWTSTNDASTTATAATGRSDDEGEDSNASNVTAIRASLQASAQNAGKAKKGSKGRRAKSAPNKAADAEDPVSRRRSAPSESQQAAEQMEFVPLDQRRYQGHFRAYDAAEVRDSDSPFMFRKRPGSRAGENTEQSTGGSRNGTKMRKPMTFLSSEGAAQNAVPAAAPVLDLSFGNGDSFAPKLNLALTDSHLNAVLPISTPPTGSRSSLRRSIRSELKAAGADITRIGEEPASSQLAGLEEARSLARQAIDRSLGERENDDLEEAHGEVEERTEGQAQQTQWPGTQVLLHQAHQDLLCSPDKQDFAASAANGTVLDDTDAIGGKDASRQPLSELRQSPSQEAPMPGTQALLNGWSPWSTVKKPRPGTTRNVAASPTQAGRLGRKRDSDTTLQPASVDARRRSSLRFSATLEDTPAAAQSTLQYGVSKSSASQERSENQSVGRTSTPKSILRKTRTPNSQGPATVADASPLAGEVTATSASAPVAPDATTEVSMGHGLSSFEGGYAQERSLFRDDSQVSQTIDEVTANLFGTGDLDGVL